MDEALDQLHARAQRHDDDPRMRQLLVDHVSDLRSRLAAPPSFKATEQSLPAGTDVHATFPLPGSGYTRDTAAERHAAMLERFSEQREWWRLRTGVRVRVHLLFSATSLLIMK